MTERKLSLFILMLCVQVGLCSAGVPVFPCEFYGDVTLNGNPAPVGTVISAYVGEEQAGTLTTTEIGRFGSLHSSYGRLIVSGDGNAGEQEITFTVNGYDAPVTASFVSGEKKRIDLSVRDTQPVSTRVPSSSSGGSGGNSEPVNPVNSPSQAKASEKAGGLDTGTDGVVKSAVRIMAADRQASVVVPEGITALENDGTPLSDLVIEAVDDLNVSGMSYAGHAYRCQPSGATFAPAITMIFTPTQEEFSSLRADEKYTVCWYNPETKAWVKVDSSMDPDTGLVSAKISHFSEFAVFVEEIDLVETDVQAGLPAGDDMDHLQTDKNIPEGDSQGWSLIIIVSVLLFVLVAGGGCYYYLSRKKQ